MRKAVSFVLALALCFGLAVPAFAADAPHTPGFTDVSATAYYAKPVAWAVEQGITKGTTSTTFSPSTSCTVAQILTFLWRSAGRPGATSANMAWKDELSAVERWAKTKGITYPLLNGYCGRDKAVEFMWRAAGCEFSERRRNVEGWGVVGEITRKKTGIGLKSSKINNIYL